MPWPLSVTLTVTSPSMSMRIQTLTFVAFASMQLSMMSASAVLNSYPVSLSPSIRRDGSGGKILDWLICSPSLRFERVPQWNDNGQYISPSEFYNSPRSPELQPAITGGFILTTVADVKAIFFVSRE